MRKRLIIVSISVLLVFILIVAVVMGPRKKTKKIGAVSWYTEHNTFDEIVNIAKKENKPIFVVFSAIWCGPCQAVKEKVFNNDDFQEVADRVVLLYIEQTDPKSKEFIKKNNIPGYPTFKIFSKDGIELDASPPNRTLEGFLEWIDNVKAGNNYYEWSLKLKKDPHNRDLVLKLEDMVAFFDLEKRIKLLRRALQLNPDFYDPVSHETYEKLARAHCFRLMKTWKKNRNNYASKNNQEFMTIINAYYPDKFKYQFKGKFDSLSWWLKALGGYEKPLDYVNDFLKKSENKIDLQEDIFLFPMVFSTLLRANRENDTKQWLTKLQNLVSKDKKQEYSYWFGRFYSIFADYYGEKGETKKAEKYAVFLFAEYTKQKREQYIEYDKLRLAKKYLLFADELVKQLKEEIKTAEGANLGRLTCNLAAIYARMGETGKAKKLFYDLYRNQSLVESLDDKRKAFFYNAIASTMLEAKIVETQTLEIAEKALKLQKNWRNLDTLASIHAALGNFKEAVNLEEKAVTLAEKDYLKWDFKSKQEKWKNKIK